MTGPHGVHDLALIIKGNGSPLLGDIIWTNYHQYLKNVMVDSEKKGLTSFL